MKIHLLLTILSALVVIAAIGCADHPVRETEGHPAGTTFTADSQQIVERAPQPEVEDKPSARLIALFPEFFPDGVKHCSF